MDRLLEATYQAEQRHFWFRGFRQFVEPLVAQAVAGIASPRILDCGCGTGHNMRMLSAFGEVWGFDLAWGGFRFAREYGQHRLARASVTEIPFKSGHFDLVTAFDILACLHEPEETRALAEITRVLRPGGAFVLNTAALPFLRGQHAVFGCEVRRATRSRLRASLERAGFEVLRITYTNFTLLPLVAPVRLGQRLIGLSTPEETGTDIAVPPEPLNTVLTALVRAEAVALRRFDMPIGSSLLALARSRP